MALHILQGLSPADQVRQSAGTDFAKMLGTGLQSLANQKMQELQRAKFGQGLEALGYAPEQAQGLSQFSPDILKEIVKSKVAPTGVGSSGLTAQEELAQRKYLKTYTDALSQDYTNAQKIYNRSQGMLKNLEKNKKKWPNLSGYLPETYHRDADIRKYIRDANELVLLSGGARKGQMTNYKARLEQAAKVSLDQPYDTQKQVLQDLINDSENVFNIHKKFNQIRTENGGRIPLDIRERIIEQGIENTLEDSSQNEKEAMSAVKDNVAQMNPEMGNQQVYIDGKSYLVLEEKGDGIIVIQDPETKKQFTVNTKKKVR